MKRNNKKGFSFIEMLITLSVLSVSFLPLMNMFSTSLLQLNTTDELTTARYLAQEGMERVKNLSFTVEQLRQEGDVWAPPLKEPTVAINGRHFRVLRKIIPGSDSDPLEVRIRVFQEEDVKRGELHKPVVEVVTLFEDFDWGYVL